MILLALLATLAAALGLLELSPVPQLLVRAIVCAVSCVGIESARRAGQRDWMWIYAVLAALYNPIVAVPLRSHSLWGALALTAVVVLWSGALRLRGVLGAAPVGARTRGPLHARARTNRATAPSRAAARRSPRPLRR